MLKAIADFFGASRYSAHSICLTNDPLIMTLYVASDSITAVSFFIISFCIYCGWRNRGGVYLTPTHCALFAIFTSLCALSHFTQTLTLFSGMYRLDVAIRAALAGVSVITAITTALEVNDCSKRA